MKIGVYPGSFDPVTKGHLDIMQRAAKLFDKLIVAVMVNPEKQYTFTEKERVALLQQATAEIPNVEIDAFHGLLAEYAKLKNATAIVKGLRALSDFEYEFQMAMTNRKLNAQLETIFLTTNAENMFLSSSMVRQVAQFGGDISPFVPDAVAETIQQHLGSKERNR